MTSRIRSATACLFLVSLATLTSPFDPSGSAKPRPHRSGLTFVERVGYQYAIEEVYWRHRIWPKGNPNRKPSLDDVMSRAQVEMKVEDYLRDSQLLTDQWQRPITQDQVQAEMDRMARNTKQPDVLRELFAALGNDPFVMAECLARPILAERILAESKSGSSAVICQSGSDLDGKANRAVIKNAWPSAFDTIARGSEPDWHMGGPPDTAYTLPEISVPLDCSNDSWTPTTLTNAPGARDSHTAVWTGSEMIVWGGNFSSTGGRYNPSTDSWTVTSITNAPVGRVFQTAVWTGSEMIVWGGYNISSYFNTGGRYNPSTDSWTPTTLTNAPAGRVYHTAVWTGSEMIVWGGANDSTSFNTGGRYAPGTDTWTATSTTNAPAGRVYHTAVWTGSEMIVWGGNFYVNTGGRYNPGTDSWTATSMTGAPAARSLHTAIWTGIEMIVWGGENGSADFASGGRYNPGTDSWTGTSPAPAARTRHTAVWTGNEMIVWGGGLAGCCLTNTGGRYNPSTDIWTGTNATNAPAPRENHTAVWSGSQMIIWGGYDTTFDFNTGGSYCAQPSAPIVQSAVSRKTHGSAGSFGVNLPLSGTPGIECRSGGATNDYTIVVTFLANVSVSGSPQAAVTLGTGTVGSGGMSNGGIVAISGNVVTIPLTNVANAQTINVTLNSVNASTNITIPMSILIGDTNANGAVNAADVAQTKARLGQTVGATNFRSDVNANGSINAADTAIVKQNSGTSLPP